MNNWAVKTERDSQTEFLVIIASGIIYFTDKIIITSFNAALGNGG